MCYNVKIHMYLCIIAYMCYILFILYFTCVCIYISKNRYIPTGAEVGGEAGW